MFKIVVGQKIQLSIKDILYNCKIHDVQPQKITITLGDNFTKDIKLGDAVYCSVRDELGSFCFFSKIVGFNIKNNSIVVDNPLQVSKIQERKFVRIQISKTINVTKINSGEYVESFETETVDVSAKGMKIISKEKLIIGQNLLLNIPENIVLKEPALILSRVVHIQEVTVNNENFYYIGLEFLGLSDKERDKISKFVIQYQCEQLQKARIAKKKMLVNHQ